MDASWVTSLRLVVDCVVLRVGLEFYVIAYSATKIPLNGTKWRGQGLLAMALGSGRTSGAGRMRVKGASRRSAVEASRLFHLAK